MGKLSFLRKADANNAPSGGTGELTLGNLAVGTTINLMIDGTETPFIIINQGIPSNSSQYDSSCDGTWLLAKEYFLTSEWSDGTEYSSFERSVARTVLNSTFINSLGTAELAAVKEVTIPYVYTNSGGGTMSTKTGANGTAVKAFLLSLPELGLTSVGPTDGAETEYFKDCADNTSSADDSLRIAKYGSNVYEWATRTIRETGGSSEYMYYIDSTGDYNWSNPAYEVCLRPAMVFDSNTKIDDATLKLKGAT